MESTVCQESVLATERTAVHSADQLCVAVRPKRKRLMRRSVRAKAPTTHKLDRARASSPSASEVTLGPTPSSSPSPEDIARHAAPPTLRDDGTPKRPMNAFILFSNEKRSELADLNPHL